MSDSQDAYGHQLYDCFRGKKVVEVVERDDGFIHTSAIYPRYYFGQVRELGRYMKRRLCDMQREGPSMLDAEEVESLFTFRREASMSLESIFRLLR